MQESISELKVNDSLQLEFDFTFDGYESEPLPQDSFAEAERLTLQAICQNPDFSDLFEDAQCINRMYDANEQKGVFYLFKAHDSITGRNIAVKTTNPALCNEKPHLQKSIEWESVVLTRLKNKNRMQQIVSPLKTMQIEVQADGKQFVFPVLFFSSIYLGIDVRKSFFDSANDKLKTCANRLNLFCSIISAVQTLHREGFCHRDLKPSNIMGVYNKSNGKCTATLIDFGLCLATEEIEKDLRLFSPCSHIPEMYCAPEIYSEFEDIWPLAQSADIYSLGCMLFELLDKRTFHQTLLKVNDKVYWEAVTNMRVGKEECGGNKEKRLALYNTLLDEFAPNIIIPRLGEDSLLPDYVREELQKIIEKMCAFDYRRRTKEEELNGIKEKIRHIVRILEDGHYRELYKRRKTARRAKLNSSVKGVTYSHA